MTEVITTCCMLVGLVLMWVNPRWFAVATSRGTETLDEDVEHSHANVPVKVTIKRHSEPVHCKQECPFLLEVILDQNSELVFSGGTRGLRWDGLLVQPWEVEKR